MGMRVSASSSASSVSTTPHRTDAAIRLAAQRVALGSPLARAPDLSRARKVLISDETSFGGNRMVAHVHDDDSFHVSVYAPSCRNMVVFGPFR